MQMPSEKPQVPRRAWSHDELVLAMNLYCQLPFGLLHARNLEVIRLSRAINRSPSSVAMKLCNLASLDPVQLQRGVRGLSKVSASDKAVWDEFHADWSELAATSEQQRVQLYALSPNSESSKGPVRDTEAFDGDTDAVREVRVRLAQRFFRRSVLASYKGRCCVSDISLSPLLIASHILPWSSYPEHRADPRNGICLSRLHDAAFDRGLITFDSEHRLVVSGELREATTNQVMNEAFLRFEGQPLRLPQKFVPNPAFMARHRERIFRA